MRFIGCWLTVSKWSIDVEEGSIAGDRVRLIDFDNPNGNHWLAVNQFTIVEGQHNKRPDIVVFVNGFSLSVIELKNAADEEALLLSLLSGKFARIQMGMDPIGH